MMDYIWYVTYFYVYVLADLTPCNIERKSRLNDGLYYLVCYLLLCLYVLADLSTPDGEIDSLKQAY